MLSCLSKRFLIISIVPVWSPSNHYLLFPLPACIVIESVIWYSFSLVNFFRNCLEERKKEDTFSLFQLQFPIATINLRTVLHSSFTTTDNIDSFCLFIDRLSYFQRTTTNRNGHSSSIISPIIDSPLINIKSIRDI